MNAPPVATPMSTMPQPALLTVRDFMLLDQSGAFDRYHKTELINGTIVFVNAQYSRHMVVKVELLFRLRDACNLAGGDLSAWSEGAVDMSPDGLPEPDLFITNQRPTTGPVRLETVMLIAEVADTTLAFDLGEKAMLYARHGVPEYWVVDVEARRLHQMWAPGAEGYGERREVALGERVEAVTIGELQVDTSDI